MQGHNGITSKIAVVLTAFALLSASGPAPESGIPGNQIDSAQSTTPATPASSQPQKPPQTAEQSKTPNTTAPGTKPANPAPANDPQSSKKHHVETRDSVGPQDGTCNQPGEHQWHGNEGGVGIGNPVILNWNEHVDSNDCVLELESGTAPNYGYIGDGSAPIPWATDASVTKLAVSQHAGTPEDPKVKILDGYGLFDKYNLPNLRTVDVANLDTSKATNLSAIFQFNPNLIQIIGLETWDTSSTLDMRWMFRGATGISQLDLSNWNINNSADMTGIFQNCTNLKTIGNPGLDIPANATQTDMYTGSGLTCSKAGRHHWTDNTNTVDWQETPNEGLTECTLTLTSGTAPNHTDSFPSTTGVPWDNDNSVATVNVNNGVNLSARGGRGLFARMNKLKTANVGNLDTSQATDMWATFWDDPALTTITGLDKWNLSNLQSMDSMFRDSTALPSLDLSKWDTHNVTNMVRVFYNCTSLSTVNISTWNTSKATDMTQLFDLDTNIKVIDLNNWTTTQVTSMDHMLPSSLQALRLGEHTTLKYAASNNAFANVGAHTWLDKTNPSSPVTIGNTAALATRAASADPEGAYVIDTFDFSFSVSAIPLTGVTREQLLRNLLLLLAAGALALTVVAVTRYSRNRWINRH